MGSGLSSRTNLGSDCTSFQAGSNGSKVRWGDSSEIRMGNFEEIDSDTRVTDVWSVEYRMGQKKSCRFSLRATRDDNGVERIFFALEDCADNRTRFTVEFTRDGRGGLLREGELCIETNTVSTPTHTTSSTRAQPNYSIKTTVISYFCSQRYGLFVLEMKKQSNSDNVFMVTLAHYYLNKDIGLSAVAKIRRKKGGFGVEVEGPFKHPSTDLRKVVVETRRTGAWSPAACSQCDQRDDTVGQLINRPSSSSTASYYQYNETSIFVNVLGNKNSNKYQDNGTVKSFNNKGGRQNLSKAKINSGAYSGDGDEA